MDELKAFKTMASTSLMGVRCIYSISNIYDDEISKHLNLGRAHMLYELIQDAETLEECEKYYKRLEDLFEEAGHKVKGYAKLSDK